MYRYVHKTGRCGSDREVLASFYGTGKLTASGERFNPHGLTAASYDYALGTTIAVTNPHNGRTCQVRVNDRGPNGIARVMGARIDLALGARDCLEIIASQYVCAPVADAFAQLHQEGNAPRFVCQSLAFRCRERRSATGAAREALFAERDEEAGTDLFRYPHQMVKRN